MTSWWSCDMASVLIIFGGLSRKWTLRWMRTAPWTLVWRSQLNERAACPVPAPEFGLQTLLPPPLPRFITVEAAGWHHQTYTPTNRRSGRDLWITPNQTAKGRRKWMRSVQLDKLKNKLQRSISCNISHRGNMVNGLCVADPLVLFPVPLSSFYYSFISLKCETYCSVKKIALCNRGSVSGALHHPDFGIC